MKKQLIHNLIVLDESGSMYPIKGQIISGFNEVLQTIRHSEKTFKNQEHVVSLISFNGIGIKDLYFGKSASEVEDIDYSFYQPDATTPLLDALGYAIMKVKADLPEENYKVMVTILTDGMENASTEYSWGTIQKMIAELTENHWTFTYIGTDHDIEKVAVNLSISNTMFFDKTEVGIAEMFLAEKEMRYAFYKKAEEENLK